MQPLIKDDDGETIRFQPNKIVAFILDACGRGDKITMNTLAAIPFDDEDRQQFAQLIGYNLSGYGELPYVSDESYHQAWEEAKKLK